MKNFIQPGRALTVAAPTGGVSSGDVVIVGALIGIATTDAVAGADIEIDCEGVYQVSKKVDDVFAVGDLVYWDATPGEATVTATGNTVLGIAVQAATGPATAVRVKLLPVHGAASAAALAALDARVTALE